jgi:pimeloyl-ACP methyl ester carboxylesterase
MGSSDGHDFAPINGYRLRYRLRGEGPLAVFGHGLLGSIEQIDDGDTPLHEFHERVRLLTYDARGHGLSEGPADAAAYTWAALGQDMAALADHAGEGQAIFGGGSMGAATALWVALEQPERVRALVLVMPPPLGGPTLQKMEEQRAIQMLELISAAVENFGLEKTLELAAQFPGFAANPEEAEQRMKWLRTQNPLAIAYAIKGLVQSPFHDSEAYRQIRVPTLVVAHEGDGLHPIRAAKMLADTIPDCRLVDAPEPGYWRAHPDEFVGEVNRFLDRVG